MILERQFFKQDTASQNRAVLGALSKVTPVTTETELNRLERPYDTIRRILGNDFYKMEDKFDSKTLVIETEGSFDLMDPKTNMQISSASIQYLVNVINGFSLTKNMERKILFCVTSTEKVTKNEIKEEDFDEITVFNTDSQTKTIENIQEYTKIREELAKIEQEEQQIQFESQQLRASGNLEDESIKTKIKESFDKLQSMYKIKNDLTKKFNDLQVSTIEKFNKIVEKYADTTLENVYNVTIIFESEYKDGDISKMDQVIFSLHDCAYDKTRKLEALFDLK